MTVFGGYARCYDLLYRDKDYAGEVRYVKAALDRRAPGVRSVLDLGCGTGRHAALLAELGLTVHGVDRSPEMLELAERRRSELPPDVASRLTFSDGDVRTVRLGRQFDAVLALFHVVSYQPTDADLNATFDTAAAHLRPSGLFLFDCWYGPAVLNQRPEIRVKRAEDEALSVVRRAEPEMFPAEHIVAVKYTLEITDRASGACRTLCETHRMRYLFEPEIERLLAQAGLRLLGGEESITRRALGPDTWSASFAAARDTQGSAAASPAEGF